MNILSRIWKSIFKGNQISADFTENELEILRKVGWRAFSQEELVEMKKIKLQMSEDEKSKAV